MPATDRAFSMPFLCASCIEHSSLARFIIANATANECSYCGKVWRRPRTIPLRELLAHMRERIEMEYEDAANSVGYETSRPIQQVVVKEIGRAHV